MTDRYLGILRTVLVTATVVALVCVPLTTALAQKTLDDRHQSNELRTRDDSAVNTGDDVSDVRRAKTYARSNYLWQFSTGPNYTVANPVEPGVLDTQAGSFQLGQPLLVASELTTGVKLDRVGGQYFVVQHHPDMDVSDEIVAGIVSAGGRVIGSPNANTFIALLNQSAHSVVSGAVGVTAVLPYQAAFKIDAKIGRTPLPDPVKAVSEIYELRVELWEGEDASQAAEAITALGGNVKKVLGDSLVVELNRALLADLAALEPVSAITEHLPNYPLGEETTTTMQTGQYNLGAVPYHAAGVDGGGGGVASPQVLMVLDSGIQLDNGDLSHERTDACGPDVSCVGPNHRKVRIYASTNAFGGTGDLVGCDAGPQGGFTHGHVVSAGALGNASEVDAEIYNGAGWLAYDTFGNPWKLDGVADHAILIAYDGQITPPNGSCSDPLLSSITPGDLYGFGDSGALGVSYTYSDPNTPTGARVVNFSWGSEANTYNADAKDIDQFMYTKKDALVFVSAGNAGADDDNNNIPDLETLGAPATTKSGFAIGASRNANTVNSPESREFFSSTGPAINTSVNRVAPQLMAPGGEPGLGSLGIPSEYACRSQDNDSANPVECDIKNGLEGTSFASPAAAGSALVVRDYFAQGFYPEGTPNVDNMADISAALLKAVLIASADYMTGANTGAGGALNSFAPYRWNNYQGYGRIQLDQALPISTWPDSPRGLIVHDPWSGTSDITLAGTVNTGQTTSATFRVCDGDDELRVALAWIDFFSSTSSVLRNNLELTLIAPSGKEYRGNYFTDDSNLDGSISGTEDCAALGSPNPDAINGVIDSGEWSLPVCTQTKISGRGYLVKPFDNANPTEAIFLSPDPDGDTVALEGTCTVTSDRALMCSGYDPNSPIPQDTLTDCTTTADCPGDETCSLTRVCDNDLDCQDNAPNGTGQCFNLDGYKQTEEGLWTISIMAGDPDFVNAQDFAVAIAGGVCLGSSVRFDSGQYTCNEAATISVNELAETGLPGDVPDEADISNRTTVEVVDVGPDGQFGTGDDTVVDSEDGLNFTKVSETALKFTSDLIGMSGATAPDPGNNVLDVRSGNILVVRYADINPDGGGAGPLRVNVSTVNCEVNLGFGQIVFNQFGQDASVLVQGGCERNVRGNFEFGFPDRYMDAGESIHYNYAFNSNESIDLESVKASLTCVEVDDDSPADCLPTGSGCVDGLAGLGGNCPGTSALDVCDPRRENNPPCPWVEVLDSPKDIGFVPAAAAMSANFSLQLAGDGPGQPFAVNSRPTVEMLLELTAATSGKTSTGLAVNRHVLNVDALSEMYSTDFPGGGTEVQDEGPGVVSNNDELPLDPITENSNFQSNDYRFETFEYSPMVVGEINKGLMAPWNFDGNDGGFQIGLAGPSDETAAAIFGIANFGEDKNFNGIEDGICEGDPSTACYNFGLNSDERCAVGDTCLSVENQAGGTAFTKNWNTKGGCGWQTKPSNACSGDPTRGCFETLDCEGVCQVSNNEIASTFDPCGDISGGCGFASACSTTIPNPNPLSPCVTDVDCGGVTDACDHEVEQTCVGQAGTCNDAGDFPTGGVWHTGPIGAPNSECTSAACGNYKVISGIGGQLIWWELLVTPVMEKVNQGIDPESGLPTHQAEIYDMAWNSAINVKDDNAAYSWEFDTDTTTLDPVDLFADNNILNLGSGGFGAVANDNNPALTGGFPMFAPVSTCWTRTPGTGAPLANTGAPCMRDDDCEPGACNGSSGGGFASTLTCVFDADCVAVSGGVDPDPDVEGELCVGAHTCQVDAGGLTVNGTVGGDRVGQNGCFFEGVGKIPPGALDLLGFAGPFDDDWNNNVGVCQTKSNLDNYITCRSDKDCEVAVGDASVGACDFVTAPANSLTDEYVKDYGPYRNHDIVAFNGPDMRFFTLEDLYGDTGNTFQASVGFINFEGTAANQAQQSYGIAIDDMVVKWREVSLTDDATSCLGTGSCATIELSTSNVFEGQTVLRVTVLESTPDAINDCDLDGPELPSDNDCDNNGTPDVVVKATSEGESKVNASYCAGDFDKVDCDLEFNSCLEQLTTGPCISPREIIFLNQTDNDPNEYKGDLTISSLGDGENVLFVADQGSANPTVTVTYLDNDDGTGNACPNAVDPSRHGNVTSGTTILLGETCEVGFIGYVLVDNGDGDDFVDSNETTEMYPQLINNCVINDQPTELHNCTARLSSSSGTVDCIKKSVIDLGTIPISTEPQQATDFWVWKMTNAQRLLPNDDFLAEFSITLQCDEIDGLFAQQGFTLNLDIDLDDQGQTAIGWDEQFESGTLGKFEAENLDAGIPGANNSEGLLNGDGYRCQYANPAWPNANSYGSTQALDCFPGQNVAQADAVFWSIDGIDTSSPDLGRAWNGNYSMYYGVYLSDPAGQFTTPAATIESVRTTDPINLATGSPELSFWHINSLLDGRILTIQPIWSADRGVVEAQMAEETTGAPITEWIRLEPFQNSYDTQGYRNYFNCMFDPIDDGNDEDDYFDPTDPDRAEGPSSTCFPNFNYSCLGDSLNPFSTESVCNATTPPLSTESPAESGGYGTGTWVKSKFDLSQYKGRRVRIRFLVSALKATSENWEGQFMNNPNPGDDGWWIDNVRMSNTFINPVHVLVDNDTVGTCSNGGASCVGTCNLDSEVSCHVDNDCENPELNNPCVNPCGPGEGECIGPAPACGATCVLDDLTVSVQTIPDSDGNGLIETLAGPGSPIEFNAVGSSGTCLSGSLQYRYVDDNSDVPLRGWSEDPIFIDAPLGDTDYRVEIRCSTDTACSKGVVVDVNVDCPSTGNLGGNPFTPGPVYALDKDTFGWGGGFLADDLPWQVWKGPLNSVPTLGGGLFITAGTGDSFDDPEPLGPAASGDGRYYIVRDGYCNAPGTWNSGGGEQVGDRDSTLP